MIRAALVAVGVLVIVVAAGCSRDPGSPRIVVGKPCVTCGMAVQEVRFAGLLRDESGDRQFDSIECLLKDAASRDARAYLADYDGGGLHAAESVWVVKGDFPTPMGGGLAAFASIESARDVAAQTRGKVLRLAELTPEVTP